MAEPKATSRTNIFLTDEDRAMIAAIQREHGLTTASSAIRLAIRETARRIGQAVRRRPTGAADGR